MPGKLAGCALENFVRDAASTFHHQTCTAKMAAMKCLSLTVDSKCTA